MTSTLLFFAVLGWASGAQIGQPVTFSNYSGEGSHRLLPETRQAPACTQQYTFSNIGEYRTLYSESYPNSYPPNLNCRYTYNSPKGTQMTLECAEFNVEPSANCQYDRFFWSLSGDPFFRDMQYVCGSGSINRVTSQSNVLTVGFRSDGANPASSTPWRYQCKINVIPTPCTCGVSAGSSRIVGGTEARQGEFPWRVLLYTSTNGPFCSGTLISPRWVLTAAHCTDNVPRGEVITADIGDHDYTIATERDPNIVVNVSWIIQNSRYDRNTQDSDTALLYLERPVPYQRNIQPLCLPWKYTNMQFDGLAATASGWGTTYYAGPLSNVLRKVELDVKSTPTCRNIYAGKDVTITENMICASRPGKDTCQSDSGGSLDYYDARTGQWYGIGIVSFGNGCADPGNPGIYVLLAKYLGWIEQNTGETFCKA